MKVDTFFKVGSLYRIKFPHWIRNKVNIDVWFDENTIVMFYQFDCQTGDATLLGKHHKTKKPVEVLWNLHNVLPDYYYQEITNLEVDLT